MRYVFPHMVQNYVDKKVSDLKKQQGVSEAEAQRIKNEQGKVKISKNPAEILSYIDSALIIEPNYQEALYFKEKLRNPGN